MKERRKAWLEAEVFAGYEIASWAIDP